jgi:exonuclease III
LEQEIRTDDRLLKADIIHLVECSLTDKDNKDEFSLEGYNQQFITIGPGKGIATYFKNDRFNPAEEVMTDKFQITKFKHEIMDIVSVYRSQSGHSLELLEGLTKMIEAGRITIITGDFNICFMENFSNRMIQGLLSMGFNQLVHEPTHIRGRHIDQVYFLDQSERLQPIVDRYSPYYSDHDGICITIPELIPKNEG